MAGLSQRELGPPGADPDWLLRGHGRRATSGGDQSRLLQERAHPGNRMTPATQTVLGLETSCDETAAAVVRRHADGGVEVLSSIVGRVATG